MTRFNKTPNADLVGLLKRYYDGCTTLEEEVRLRGMLTDADCGVSEADREVLLFLLAKHGSPADLDQRIRAQVRMLARRERIRRSAVWFSSVAASVAVVFLVWTYTLRQTPTAGQPTSPENAMYQARQALMSVSEGLNDAEQQMQEPGFILDRMVVNNEVEMDELMIEALDDSLDCGAGRDSSRSETNK